MGPVDYVVPAHNEQDTIRAVVLAIHAAASARRVIVIADACTDQTAAEAGSAWAEVVHINAADKGSAMAAGLNMVQSNRVGFIDGDLHGLTPGDVDRLAAAPADSMAVGLRGRAARIDLFPLFSIPPIGGERILPAAVARDAQLNGSGYAAEMRLAAAAKRAGLRTVDVPLRGVTHRTRTGPRAAMRWAQVTTGYAHYVNARQR